MSVTKVTFCKRKYGLLKKAAELATLCGVKICLLFSDLLDGVHYLSNDPNMTDSIEQAFSAQKKAGAFLYSYTLDDVGPADQYPFKGMGEDRKSTLRSIYPSNRSQLSKRRRGSSFSEDESAGLESEDEILMPKPVPLLSGVPRLQPAAQVPAPPEPMLLAVPAIEKRDPQHRSDHTSSTGYILKNMSETSKNIFESFLAGVDNLMETTLKPSNKDIKRDEDVVSLVLLRHIIHRYFSTDISDAIGSLMRSKIREEDLLSSISNIRFKDKNPDMILIVIKQMNDNLLESIINPSTFNSQIDIQKAGKSLVNIFIFLVKNFYQQIKTMRSIYCEESASAESHFLFSTDTINSLKLIVGISLDLCQQETSRSCPSVHSAFQLHPSQKNDQPQDLVFHSLLNPDNNSRQMNNELSGTFMDRHLTSLHKSRGLLDRHSFEFAGSLRSELSGMMDIHGALRSSGNNMNKFVSSLLRDNHQED